MLIKTLCLAAGPAAQPALAQAAKDALRDLPGLTQVLVSPVLRHIPTDSLNDQKSHSGVVPQADRIDTVVDLYFGSSRAGAEAVASPAWRPWLDKLAWAATVLFILDTGPNIPIAPQGAAADGGFRRWMLLARKEGTQGDFRDAWFGRHASLVQQLPHVEGYLQHLVTQRYGADGHPVGYEELPIDGIAELCFRDEAAMGASYASEARDPLREDGRNLLGRITTVLVQGKAFR